MTSQSTSIRILAIGNDAELASTRAQVLESAGFETQVRTCDELVADQDLQGFHVFLICQSVHPQTAAHISTRLRKQLGRCRILRIRSTYPDWDHVANLYLSAPVAPEDLVKGIEMLVRAFPD